MPGLNKGRDARLVNAVNEGRLARDALHAAATRVTALVLAAQETEEEKALRAEERQRKNRESAARSHRKKAQMAAELEQRAKTAEARVESLEKEVAKLLSAQRIVDPEVVSCKQTCWQQVEAIKNINALPGRRQIVVNYRGQKTKAKVACICEELELHIAAAL